MNPEPPADDYPNVVEHAIRAMLADDWYAGAAALAPIAGLVWTLKIQRARVVAAQVKAPVEVGEGSRQFTKARAGATYRRDRFQCRYRGGRALPVALMSLLSSLYPGQVPFVDTYKAVHPTFWTRGAEADHIVPGSRGGDWLDPDNHATACARCNTAKSDHSLEEIGWQLLPPATDDWDGLVGLYEPLWVRAGRPRERYHRDWIRALTA